MADRARPRPEHLRVKGRMKWYESVEEMQEDLEMYLEHYNRERPQHEGPQTLRRLRRRAAEEEDAEEVSREPRRRRNRRRPDRPLRQGRVSGDYRTCTLLTQSS